MAQKQLTALADRGHDIDRLPFALRLLLENLLRHEDGVSVTRSDIEALVGWQPGALTDGATLRSRFVKPAQQMDLFAA